MLLMDVFHECFSFQLKKYVEKRNELLSKGMFLI